MKLRWMVLAASAILVAVVLWSRRPRPVAPPSVGRQKVKLIEVPAHVDGEIELWKTELGRVVVRSSQDRRAREPHFHRHAHETWIPLGEAEATWSEGGRWAHARWSAPKMLYTPPYAISSWKGDGEILGFITAPEDEPAYGSDLQDAADAALLDSDSKWMLEKLERITVTGTQRIGPWARPVALYVVAGRGELRAGGVDEVAARHLAAIDAGTMVDVVAKSPLTLVIFDAARTTVSPILKEGTKRYSQDDEELVIRDFFRDRQGGFFLDVGAGHWQRDSTTLYLEERLGWSGVAIDALAEYAEDYRLHRKRTTFVNRLITDKPRGLQKFYRAEAYPEVSSVSKQLAEKQARELADGGAVRELTIPSSTLDEVLDGLSVKAIDFLSMDIEEHEPAALAGFEIARFHPAFVCVEAHPAVRDALWRYFRRHGYVRQDQYLAWDSANWYFAPR